MGRSVAGGLSLLCLPRHPYHGSPKWKAFWYSRRHGLRPWCGGQYQLSFFGCRAGSPSLRQPAL